ncbi:N-acetylglucosamine-6-phosphate deacetylase [Tahibacter soli]|uniref:N-acetylglucosamine-6-phosphate deacetylase n=1 Tax=Tahibacter soli TaxID=2983605 RepID=A0A9X3YHJ8_9GAMM|nr:N-acetylglucosamine-6-phosphate deacetylase [Tahibacter soli]MDC8010923.1 N-acetylglucosamine-6-phosphate deacetylase [Tahibacter soli]
MTQALLNARVLTDDGFATGLAVLVDGARIAAVVSRDDPRAAAASVVDLEGAYLVPGFIDCQVNGGGGVLFNDEPTVEGIRAIGAAHRRYGTTGFLPTLISDDRDVMRAAIDATDAAIDAGVPGVLGVHLEGPYLAPERKGTHDATKFLRPDDEDVALVASGRRGVTLVTLAPERVGDAELASLIARGVIVAAGHTAADYATARRALDAGVRGVTHLFNAMTPLTSREPGVVGAALDHADSWCGLIVDGHHVHWATLRIAIAAKPRGRMFLVTDAMPPVGSDRPWFELDGRRVELVDGALLNPDGVLAGSALDMLAAVRNTVRHVGLPLAEAARMASTYPAQFLGLGASHGRIAAGYAADFVALDDELTIRATWIGGQGN